jgi:hypothetical protein
MNNFKSTYYTLFVVNSLFDVARLCAERLLTKPPYWKLLAMVFYYDNSKRQNHSSKPRNNMYRHWHASLLRETLQPRRQFLATTNSPFTSRSSSRWPSNRCWFLRRFSLILFLHSRRLRYSQLFCILTKLCF